MLSLFLHEIPSQLVIKPAIANSIIYFNDVDFDNIQIESDFAIVNYTDVQGGWPGIGIIDEDPSSPEVGSWDPNGTPEDTSDDFWIRGDYHLQS